MTSLCVFIHSIKDMKSFQAYGLCRAGYDFALLDNAFLVHKHGIKSKEENAAKIVKNKSKINQQTDFILNTVLKTMNSLYGSESRHCHIKLKKYA